MIFGKIGKIGSGKEKRSLGKMKTKKEIKDYRKVLKKQRDCFTNHITLREFDIAIDMLNWVLGPDQNPGPRGEEKKKNKG